MIPETMKAVQLTRHGDLDALVYREDVAVPQPGDGEVLIEVAACGMNNTDVWVRQGAYGSETDPAAISSWRRGRPTLSFPRIQGADIVGRVVATGTAVPQGRIGQRVMVDFSLYNRNDDSLADIDYIGHGRDGGYAEYVTVPAENAHHVNTAVSDAELATFCCAYLTGEHMLQRAAVRAGERVLVTGASGGVGSGIVQLCRARGAIPYASRQGARKPHSTISVPRLSSRATKATWYRRSTKRPAANRSTWSPTLSPARCSTLCCAFCVPRGAIRRPAPSPARWFSWIFGPCT